MRLSFYPSSDTEYGGNTKDLEKASGLGAEMELLIYSRCRIEDRESGELRIKTSCIQLRIGTTIFLSSANFLIRRLPHTKVLQV